MSTPGRSEYPIDFLKATDPRIIESFRDLGFDDSNKAGLVRIRTARTALIQHGHLLSLSRPVRNNERPVDAYLHPDYTREAFRNAPDAPSTTHLKAHEWFGRLEQHLDAFAKQPEATVLIRDSIVTHYSRIAAAAVRLSLGGDAPWIAARALPGQRSPLAFVGAENDSVVFDRDAEILLEGPAGRLYLPVNEIAKHIGWVIPNILDPSLQAAIADGFAETSNPAQQAADPERLFMAGWVALQGEVKPIQEVFGN